MAAAKTFRFQWNGEGETNITRTWDTQQTVVLEPGDTIDVPVDKAEWLGSLTGWTRVPKQRKPPPKKKK